MSKQGENKTKSMTKDEQPRIVTNSLGELIRLRRERMGLARTKLAEFTGISPHTMVKYEKAGEPEGKFPSLPKLTKICEVLEIDPRIVLDRVSEFNFFAEKDPLAEGEIPFESAFNFSSHFRTESEWNDIRFSITETIEINEQYSVLEHRLDQQHEILKRIAANLKKNDPDHEDPSRSEKSTSEPEVAPTTPSNHPKDEGG